MLVLGSPPVLTTRARSTEAAVLCACARRRAQVSGIQSLPGHGDVDWDALLHMAAVHGVTELLLAPLASSALQVPPAILAHLEQRAIEATGLNLNRTTQLVGLLRLLADHQIRALTFKGPTLAAGAYGHLGRRISSDLDLLVDRRDVARVRPLLLSQGHVLPTRPRRRGGSLLYGLIPSTGFDDTLLPGDDWRSSVDVHVAFAYWTLGVRLDTRGIFNRSVTVDVAGHAIATLCPEDLLLALAIHGMMHGWTKLRLVSDVDAVSDHVSDWPAVISRAERASMRRVLSVALLLAQRLLGTALPEPMTAVASRDLGAMTIVQGVVARMFDAADQSAGWDPRPWQLSFMDGPRRRFGFLARDLVYEWFLKWPWDAWLGRRDVTRL